MSSFLRVGKGGLGRHNEKRKYNSYGPSSHLCHKCGKPFTEEWSLRGHLSRCQVEKDHTVTQTYTRSAMNQSIRHGGENEMNNNANIGEAYRKSSTTRCL
jgi:hypothetical protein